MKITDKQTIELAEELFDKYSEHIDDNMFSLEAVAGTSVVKQSDFNKAVFEAYTAGYRAAEQTQQWVPLPAPQLPEGRYDLWYKETGSRLVNISLDRRHLQNGIFGISHVMPVPTPPQTETGLNHKSKN